MRTVTVDGVGCLPVSKDQWFFEMGPPKRLYDDTILRVSSLANERIMVRYMPAVTGDSVLVDLKAKRAFTF